MRGRVNKVAVICQRVIMLLQVCADMIYTFHFIPKLNHLEHIEHCYKVINAKAKFSPCVNLEFAFLRFL